MPEQDVALVVLVNTEGEHAQQFAERLTRLFVPEPQTQTQPQVPPQVPPQIPPQIPPSGVAADAQELTARR
ncbi:MAG: hypothetical protein EXS13_13715 [Planctomycetes bacterium]|nr:hypothetical protein [Planctomycetota bacterium]